MSTGGSSPGESSTGGSSTGGSSTGDTETGGIDPLPECGNGIVEVGEACDDQGESEACDADCTPVDCGDGWLNGVAGEQCDDAGESTRCNYDCTLADCGDGLLNPTAGEQCDAGGQTAFCDVDCTPAFCGDGTFNAAANEHCDGMGRTAACNDNCTLHECGDAWLNTAAGEECDGGGETATCNSDCTVRICGDGITNLTAGEACDDAGNSVACDADCTPRACGDGFANSTAGEECDADDLLGVACPDLGFDVGALACGGSCLYDFGDCWYLPELPVLNLSFSQVKRFDFSWGLATGAEYYQLLESPALGEPYAQLGGDIIEQSVSFTMPLHLRVGASYVLRACNGGGCTDSAPVDVVGSLATAVGYVKASNPNAIDQFGQSVAVSGDGNTLVVGAHFEDSAATGIGGNQTDNNSSGSGAVYVFVRNGAGVWSQQAYLKASNTGLGDQFGVSVAVSVDGNTLAVGANLEDSATTGINGDQTSNASLDSGAVYVFARDGMGVWSQQAYVKASNSGATDYFGWSMAMSGDGNTLAVGAHLEDSNATGVNGDQTSNMAADSGAVYVFVRNGMGVWSQQAYLKASNPAGSDYFGYNVAVSGSGNTLVVGAYAEDSSATGIGGNQVDNTGINSGAVYVFVRDGMGVWSQQAYVKASNTGVGDQFGVSVGVSGDGNTLAVGANLEDSNATGIDGNQANNSSADSGAVYVFMRNEVGEWSQQGYVKASNTSAADTFGLSLAMSADGSMLMVGARDEDSSAVGVGGDSGDDGSLASGAVYVLVRDGMGAWSHRAYVKAANTGASDNFGHGVAMSGNGNTIAVSSFGEDSNATGISGNQLNESLSSSGAVYLY